MKNNESTRIELMKNGSVNKTLLTLAIPSMIGMVASALYNLVDTMFVGMLRDTNSMAAVSVSFPFFVILMALGLLIGVGTASCVGRYLGASKYEKANRAAGISILLSITFSVIVMIVGFIFMDEIMKLMGASNEVLPYAKSYSNWLLIGAIFTITNLVLNNLLRSEGATKKSMTTIIVGAIANIVLDPIFMWVFHMGLVGAAVATAISQGISTFLMAMFYYKGKAQLKLNKTTIFSLTKDDKKIVKDIFLVGVPVFVSQFLAAVAFTILNSTASVFGASALAAMGIVNKIYTIVTQMIAGFNNAFLPFASFNVGAERYDRVKKAIRFSLMITFAYSIFMTIIICIIPESFIGLFSSDVEVIKLGANALKMQNYLLIGYSFILIMTSTFQAMKETNKAGFLSFARQGILLIPLTFILPKLFSNYVPALLQKLGSYPMESGLYGIMLAQPMADLFTMFLCAIFSIHTFKKLNKLSH